MPRSSLHEERAPLVPPPSSAGNSRPQQAAAPAVASYGSAAAAPPHSRRVVIASGDTSPKSSAPRFPRVDSQNSNASLPLTGSSANFMTPRNARGSTARVSQVVRESFKNHMRRMSGRASSAGGHYSPESDTGFDSRRSADGTTRDSVHSTDMGKEMKEEPSATLWGTWLNVVSCVIGAGILVIPNSYALASLSVGVFLTVVFMFVSIFSSYTLSVAIEHTQCYSQAQLLARVLVGFGPDESMMKDDGEDNNDDASQRIGDDDAVGNNEQAYMRSSEPHRVDDAPATPVKSKSPTDGADAAADDDDDERKLHQSSDDNSNSIQRVSAVAKLEGEDEEQKQEPPSSSATPPAAVDSEISPMTPPAAVGDISAQTLLGEQVEEELLLDEAELEYDDAMVEADGALNRINLVTDTLLGFSYYLYCISYSRVVGDSMSSVSTSLNFPEIFHQRLIWLVIGGVIFLVTSMRRVFAELTVTSIIALLTILLCVIAIVVRFCGGPNSELPPFYSGVKYFDVNINMLNAFATLCSAYGYQVNHPAFYLELKTRTPAAMQRPVVGAMVTIGVMYIVTGVFGYLIFGDKVTDSAAGGDIINNFSNDDVFVNVCRVGLLAHFGCVFPLLLTAVKQCSHRVILRLRGLNERADDSDEVFKYPFSVMAVEITVITVSAVVIGGLIPGLSIVINLAGLLGGMSVVVIFPSIIGYYVYDELEVRLGSDGTKTGMDAAGVSDRVKDPVMNNFGGCSNIAQGCFFNFRFLKGCCLVLMVLGPIIMIVGLIVVLQDL